MIYPFEDVDTGAKVDIEMPVAKAVPIGAVIRRHGRRFRRLISGQAPVVNHYDALCWTMAPGAPGFDHYHPVTGQGIISSRKVVDEVSARNPGVIWDK